MEKQKKEKLLKEVGKEFRKLRARDKLTPYKINKDYKIAVPRVLKLESGETSPLLHNLFELAAVYKTPLSEILKNVEERL